MHGKHKDGRVGMLMGGADEELRAKVVWADGSSTDAFCVGELTKATATDWEVGSDPRNARQETKTRLGEYVEAGGKVGQIVGDDTDLTKLRVKWIGRSSAEAVDYRTLNRTTKGEYDKKVCCA